MLSALLPLVRVCDGNQASCIRAHPGRALEDKKLFTPFSSFYQLRELLYGQEKEFFK